MIVPPRTVAHYLDERHYLGATGRGFAWSDEFGVLVLAKPTARRLPQDGTWLELVRWCLEGIKNGGSQQWSRVVKVLRREYPEVTTVVSYSDPSVGHTGALYKACNWRWAPTWHRLQPPPSGNGTWSEEPESVKDRWVFELRPDGRRNAILEVDHRYLVKTIRSALTPDLLAPAYRDNPKTHCYVASEAFYHATGGRDGPWHPCRCAIEGGQHWWLEDDDGRKIDLTADQFKNPVDYAAGRRAAFLTRQPSKRAQIVLERLRSSHARPLDDVGGRA